MRQFFMRLGVRGQRPELGIGGGRRLHPGCALRKVSGRWCEPFPTRVADKAYPCLAQHRSAATETEHRVCGHLEMEFTMSNQSRLVHPIKPFTKAKALSASGLLLASVLASNPAQADRRRTERCGLPGRQQRRVAAASGRDRVRTGRWLAHRPGGAASGQSPGRKLHPAVWSVLRGQRELRQPDVAAVNGLAPQPITDDCSTGTGASPPRARAGGAAWPRRG